MRVKRKLKGSSGFTLGETLVTVLILLLVSVIVASGTPAAKNAYEKVVVASNAQVLLSTTITALRDELGTARDINKKIFYNNGETAKTGTTITYYDADNGATSQIYVQEATADKASTIRLQEYIDTKPGPGTGEPQRVHSVDPRNLVSDKAITMDLSVSYDSLAYNEDKGVITFTNLKVSHSDGTGEPLAIMATLNIRVITATSKTAATP